MIGDALLALCVGLTGALYWRGLARLRQRARRGRPHPALSQRERNCALSARARFAGEPLPLGEDGRRPGEGVLGQPRPSPYVWRAVAFAGGLLTLVVALLSPVDWLVDRSFALHMTQHVLLIAVAAPLLALGEPLVPFLWALPLDRRRAVGAWWHGSRALRPAWRLLSAPLVAWPLHTVTLWAWHAPPLFEAALRNDLVHALEHATFIATALLFWWPVVHAGRGRRLSHAGALAYLFTAAGAATVLGVLIAFAPSPWYATYAAGPSALGLTPLEDQSAAGLVMWIGGGTLYLAAILAVFLGWLHSEERAAEQPVVTRRLG